MCIMRKNILILIGYNLISQNIMISNMCQELQLLSHDNCACYSQRCINWFQLILMCWMMQLWEKERVPPLSILPLMCPVRFSKLSLHIMYPRNYNWFFLILSMSVLFATIFFKSRLLLMCFVHGILSIPLLNYISFVLSLLVIPSEIVQHSLKYWNSKIVRIILSRCD